MWCEDKISHANNGKNNFDTCVTDKHLERLKVRVTNYQIGGIGPSKPRSESREAADNLTEYRANGISGDEVSGNEN